MSHYLDSISGHEHREAENIAQMLASQALISGRAVMVRSGIPRGGRKQVTRAAACGIYFDPGVIARTFDSHRGQRPPPAKRAGK